MAPESSNDLADAIWSALLPGPAFDAATDRMYSSWRFCVSACACNPRSVMPLPRAIRYTSIPRIGRMMMNSAHRVFAPPPRSLLRKRSPKTQNRHMNQATKMKNSNSASRNDPLLLNTGSTPFPGTPPVAPTAPANHLGASVERMRVPPASPVMDEVRAPAGHGPGGP